MAKTQPMKSRRLFVFYSPPHFLFLSIKAASFPFCGELACDLLDCRPWITILYQSQINLSLLENYLAAICFRSTWFFSVWLCLSELVPSWLDIWCVSFLFCQLVVFTVEWLGTSGHFVRQILIASIYWFYIWVRVSRKNPSVFFQRRWWCGTDCQHSYHKVVEGTYVTESRVSLGNVFRGWGGIVAWIQRMVRRIWVIAPVSLVSVLFRVETLSFLSSADSTDFREIIRRKMGQI